MTLPLLSNRQKAQNSASLFVLIISAVVYWLTADSSVSFWDCPEYVTCASLLEIGHPPGNPVWMLAMRFVTIPFPASLHAYVINLCSGLFMALSAFLLSRIIFDAVCYVITRNIKGDTRVSASSINAIAFFSSIGGGLTFALCDSTWYSAVEAEVYAMSAFLSALTIWLMVKWAKCDDPSRRLRILILIAYIIGLSLGVHQLNLLCIPVLALIFVFREYPEGCQTLRGWCAILLSFVIVALILIGMMNGVLTWAKDMELFAVNKLHLPYFSGVLAYILLLFFSFATSAVATGRRMKTAGFITVFFFIWLSGIFIFDGNIAIGGIISAIISSAMLFRKEIRDRAEAFVWMLGFILLGFLSFSVILIRGYSAPPMNEASPSNIFALSSYISRDQYGSRPLLYGATPYSKPVLIEEWENGDSVPKYTRYKLKNKGAKYAYSLPGARLHHRSGFMTASDSAVNNSLVSGAVSSGYILGDYSFDRVTTPELDMWLPRITGNDPNLLDSYDSWVGMNKETMTKVEISEAIDSLGKFIGKADSEGHRAKSVSYRPTYMQNLQMLLSYQIYYMYFRYLLWNFAGRQNDIPSTGEIDHGNFVTGLDIADDAMLGTQSLMPEDASSGNPGRNIYYCIPLLFGLAGIIFLALSGKGGKRVLAVNTIFFLMTGIAIVVYLNQTPGEPRERDYSFLGSYMAYSVWVAFGFAACALALFRKSGSHTLRSLALILPPLGVAALMGVENYDDHDRSGRFETAVFAANALETMKDGIIFTQGDNFTFPMWYSLEVEKRGGSASVIDISYLATPDYVTNLMKQGNISFIAKEADIAFGAYAFTRIANDADTIPVKASDALRNLYSQRSGQPYFKHSKVIVPRINGSDSLIIDLRKSFGSNISFKHLMMLDIISANLEKENPKNVYFLSHLPLSFHKALKPALRSTPFAELYAPGMKSDTYMSSLSNNIKTIKEGTPATPDHYMDPVLADAHRRQRGALIRAAGILLDKGLTDDAAFASNTAVSLHPYTRISPGSFTVADSTFYEGLEMARLLYDLADATHSEKYSDRADSILDMMRSRAVRWKAYHSSLPLSRRATVSNESRRLILTLPMIDSLTAKRRSPLMETNN